MRGGPLELKSHSRHEPAVKLSLLLLPHSFVCSVTLQTSSDRGLWCCGSNSERGRYPFLTGYDLVTEAAPTKGDPCQDMGRPTASRSHSRGPSCIWARWRLRVAFPVEVMPQPEVRKEWNIAESSHRPGPETPTCGKKPGGWRAWGALDSKINSRVIHMEASGMRSVWWRGP